MVGSLSEGEAGLIIGEKRQRTAVSGVERLALVGGKHITEYKVDRCLANNAAKSSSSDQQPLALHRPCCVLVGSAG